MELRDFFSLWVDADSCPKKIRPVIMNCAKRLQLDLYFVACRHIQCEHVSVPFFHEIIVKTSLNSADNYIYNNVKAHDIVITRDIVFASRLIGKAITTINDRGLVFDNNNLPRLLKEREYNMQFTHLGLENKNKREFPQALVEAFANCLDREITKKVQYYKNYSLHFLDKKD